MASGENEGKLDVYIDFSVLEPLREFFDERSFERLRSWYEAEYRRRYYRRYHSPDILMRRLLLAIKFGFAVNAKSRIDEIGDNIEKKFHEFGMRQRESQIEAILAEAERASKIIDEEPQRLQDIENWLVRYDSWVDSRLSPAIAKASFQTGYGLGKSVEITWKVTEAISDKVGYGLGYGIVMLGYGTYKVIVFVSKKTLEGIRAARTKGA